MDIGRIGLWTFHLDLLPSARACEVAAELEGLGYSAVWIPEAINRDPMVSATLLLGATQTLQVATGVVNLYSRTPMALNAATRTIEEAFPARFVCGIGVSHSPSVEGLHGVSYGKPIATMRDYLDRMDRSIFIAPNAATEPRRVLAALGPKMLALAAERTDGALTYNVTPEHTKLARDILGDKLLAVEQKVILTTDAEKAREIGRGAIRVYVGLPNYVNNWKRLGFTDDDITGLSDRFVDATFAHGDEATIQARIQEHIDAGADHVAVQVFPADGPTPEPDWRTLAPALLAP